MTNFYQNFSSSLQQTISHSVPIQITVPQTTVMASSSVGYVSLAQTASLQSNNPTIGNIIYPSSSQTSINNTFINNKVHKVVQNANSKRKENSKRKLAPKVIRRTNPNNISINGRKRKLSSALMAQNKTIAPKPRHDKLSYKVFINFGIYY